MGPRILRKRPESDRMAKFNYLFSNYCFPSFFIEFELIVDFSFQKDQWFCVVPLLFQIMLLEPFFVCRQNIFFFMNMSIIAITFPFLVLLLVVRFKWQISHMQLFYVNSNQVNIWFNSRNEEHRKFEQFTEKSFTYSKHPSHKFRGGRKIGRKTL